MRCLASAVVVAIALVPSLAGAATCPVVVRAHFSDPADVASLASWLEPLEVRAAEKVVLVEVHPDQLDRLRASGFAVEVDHALTAELCAPPAVNPKQTSGIPGYPCYATVAETTQRLADLVARHPGLAAMVDLGDSWEKTRAPTYGAGHDLLLLRLGRGAADQPPGSRPALFVTGGVHAREYAPPEILLRFAEGLLAGYGLDADATWLLEEREIHLLLHANPDGRVRAETGLSWRKNADDDHCPATNTRGVDLNRNFDFDWGCCNGSSGEPCDLVFRGPAPASEPETVAIQDHLRRLYPRRWEPTPPPDTSGLYLDVHSYGGLVLWPWGSTGEPSPNHRQLRTLGRKMAFFNGYVPQQAMQLYPTDGTTSDFAYGDLGVASYTVEVGTRFFQDCADFESRILPDNLDLLTYAAKVADAPYLTPAGPDVVDVDLEPAGAVVRGDPVRVTARLDDTRYGTLGGVEPQQAVVEAQLSVDRPPWADPPPAALAMTSVDGALDSPVEAVNATLSTADLAPGRHLLYVRGRDADGTWGAVSATFLWVTEPGLEPRRPRGRVAP